MQKNNRTLDLVLENIRLSSLERLIQEAASDEEYANGVKLINESIQQVEKIILKSK